uniref:Uncharacterized protein n=1 Tax=viral metagenome TaxID=1070528 RepID=A0A6C0CPR4_9ZZZZ
MPLQGIPKLNQLTNFILDDQFVNMTIDVAPIYYNSPPSTVPHGYFCMQCMQSDVHLPSCPYQKKTSTLYMLEEECARLQMNCEQLIHQHPNVTSTRYEIHQQRQPSVAGGIAVQHQLRLPDARKTHFANHVEMGVLYHVQEQDFDSVETPLERNIFKQVLHRRTAHNTLTGFVSSNKASLKLNKTHLRIMSAPPYQRVFEEFIDMIVQRLRPFVAMREHLLVVQDMNFQFELVSSLDLMDIFERADTNIHQRLVLKERHNVPSSENQTMRAKGISLKYVDLAFHTKYSLQIFRTGVIQLFISSCQQRDINKMCVQVGTEPFFDRYAFDVEHHVKDILAALIFFITRNMEHSQPLQPYTQQPLSEASEPYTIPIDEEETMDDFGTNRLDGKKTVANCTSARKPTPYSFVHGSCANDTNYEITYGDPYPCCRAKSAIRDTLNRYSTLPIKLQTDVIRGKLKNNGYVYINNVRTMIKTVHRHHVVTTNGQRVQRTDLDREYSYNPYKVLQRASKKWIMRTFVTPYFPIRSPTQLEENRVLHLLSTLWTHNNVSRLFNYVITLTLPETDVRTQLCTQVPSNSHLACLLVNETTLDVYVIDMYGNITRNVSSPIPDVRFAQLHANEWHLFRGCYHRSYFHAWSPNMLGSATPLNPRNAWIVYDDATQTATIHNMNSIQCPLLSRSTNMFGNRQNDLIRRFRHKFVVGHWYLFEKTKSFSLFQHRVSYIREPLFVDDQLIQNWAQE